METSSSHGNDWAPSQSLPFFDRATEAVLPTPSSQRHSPSYTHTHFSLHSLSSPLWRCNQDGIKQPVESHCIWMKGFLTQQHQWGQTHNWESTCHPHLSLYWENGDRSGDLLVRAVLVFLSIARLFLFASSVGPSCAVSALRRVRTGLLCLFPFLDKYLWQTPVTRQSGKAWRNRLCQCSEKDCDKY